MNQHRVTRRKGDEAKIMITLPELRKDYARGSLDERSVDPDPVRQFQRWMLQALASQLPEPNAMTVATVDSEGCPSARVLLLKGVDEPGFVFFTNYESRKGQELAANPRACLLFYWTELERQVRVTGVIAKTSPEESDAYFAARPLGSRIGAWASEQSREIAGRAELEARARAFAERFDEHPPRPPHWGGYRLVPETVEFWQGRPSRLHDRLLYARETDGSWHISRLSP